MWELLDEFRYLAKAVHLRSKLLSSAVDLSDVCVSCTSGGIKIAG